MTALTRRSPACGGPGFKATHWQMHLSADRVYHLTPIRAMLQAGHAVAHSTAGIDVPNLGARSAAHEAWRFFHARVSTGRSTSHLLMVDGAREPKGSPVQGRYVNRASSATYAYDVAVADSSRPLESTL